MNTNHLAAMAMAAALIGFTHTLAAEENISATAANDVYQQNAPEPKPEAENLVPEMAMPEQTVPQPADNLLSELKVYPSF